MILVIGITFMIISFWVSSRLKSKFRKYSQTTLMSNMSGAEVAHKMLRDNGLYDVNVTCYPGCRAALDAMQLQQQLLLMNAVTRCNMPEPTGRWNFEPCWYLCKVSVLRS